MLPLFPFQGRPSLSSSTGPAQLATLVRPNVNHAPRQVTLPCANIDERLQQSLATPSLIFLEVLGELLTLHQRPGRPLDCWWLTFYRLVRLDLTRFSGRLRMR